MPPQNTSAVFPVVSLAEKRAALCGRSASSTPASRSTALAVCATARAGSVASVHSDSSRWPYRPPPTRAASAVAYIPRALPPGLPAGDSKLAGSCGTLEKRPAPSAAYTPGDVASGAVSTGSELVFEPASDSCDPPAPTFRSECVQTAAEESALLRCVRRSQAVAQNVYPRLLTVLADLWDFSIIYASDRGWLPLLTPPCCSEVLAPAVVPGEAPSKNRRSVGAECGPLPPPPLFLCLAIRAAFRCCAAMASCAPPSITKHQQICQSPCKLI